MAGMRHVELTLKSARVIRAFLDDPGKPRYGYELTKAAHLSSGTLYPILARLERAGWLAAEKEDVNPSAAGRPARTNYVITSEAVPVARARLAAISAELGGQ
jgi:PadR family transcriptional regulator, regulatory protein PadR